MNKIISAGRHITASTVARHSHEFWELVYCVNGNGCFYCADGNSMHYEKGDIVCIPPMMEHSNVTEQGFTNIHILMDNLEFMSEGFVRIKDNSSKILLESFTQSYYFFSSNLPYRYALLTSIGELIGACLLSFSDNSPYSPLVERIRTEIIKSFTYSSFDLSQTLLLMPNNPEYLRKIFKKETGTTPLQFLTDTRINYAKKLLKARQRPSVSETAHECGFDDPLYFSRLFKKYTGVSPKDYSKGEGTD